MRFGLLPLDVADFKGVQTGPSFGEAQGYTNRENIHELAEKNIDFVGSLANNAAKARTNQQRFAATQFVYEAELDRYICPTGKPLLYEGRHECGGVSYYKYKATAQDCEHCSLRASCCAAIKSTPARLCVARRVRS